MKTESFIPERSLDIKPTILGRQTAIILAALCWLAKLCGTKIKLLVETHFDEQVAGA